MADGSSDSWTSIASLTNRQSGTGRQRSWNNTLNFSSVPKEQRPVNGYSDNIMSWDQNPYDLVYRYKATGLIYYEAYNQLRPGNTIRNEWGTMRNLTQATWDARQLEVENESAVKVLGKMADAKVNLAVAYAEAHKTSSLILDTANRIDRAYRAFRKGNLKGVAENLNITPKKLHKSWLEYKYGWMPLLMDVKGSAEFFAQQVLTRKPKFRVTAVTTSERSESNTINHGNPFGVAPAYFSTGYLDRKYTVKTSLWCELSSPHYSELQQLGLTNPALVAWELVPFSFVFDWFIQVGDYLTALSAFHGVTVIRGVRSSIREEKYRRSYPTVSRVDSTYTYYQSTINGFYTDRYYTRVPYVPHPWDLSIPKVNGFDFPKLVTSLALLRGSHRSTTRT